MPSLSFARGPAVSWACRVADCKGVPAEFAPPERVRVTGPGAPTIATSDIDSSPVDGPKLQTPLMMLSTGAPSLTKPGAL